MSPEEEPIIDLDEEEPGIDGLDEEKPIIVDLDESVFEILRRVEKTSDPSEWIRAAVREKADRDVRARRDVTGRLNELLDEMIRIVKLEQEFAGPGALEPLRELTGRLRDAGVLVERLGPILDGPPPGGAGRSL